MAIRPAVKRSQAEPAPTPGRMMMKTSIAFGTGYAIDLGLTVVLPRPSMVRNGWRCRPDWAQGVRPSEGSRRVAPGGGADSRRFDERVPGARGGEPTQKAPAPGATRRDTASEALPFVASPRRWAKHRPPRRASRSILTHGRRAGDPPEAGPPTEENRAGRVGIVLMYVGPGFRVGGYPLMRKASYSGQYRDAGKNGVYPHR